MKLKIELKNNKIYELENIDKYEIENSFLIIKKKINTCVPEEVAKFNINEIVSIINEDELSYNIKEKIK